MIYIPPDVHRAMEQATLDGGYRFTSDAYTEAAESFLAARGISVAARKVSEAASPTKPAPSIADLVVAIDGLGRRVEEVAERDARTRPSAQQPAGTRAAEAMQAVLSALREAGGDGLSGHEMSKVVQGRGIRSGAEEAAKAVLRAAGLVRCEGRRWYLEGSARAG
ncbi:hypothetical protein ASF53_11855 [Methylobacterium sp. Leaf123]|uniref:hypothetical protein n=1 Tax=Methylobacterium sp. Leaf123 TaxID=1736264 RepID=UPI0006F7A7C3|nr:hypothetical protein [Methylobacterium sp. Leaf123]KQQ13659.1 hypothetical protein ASF53_11855 [Methylobacterium sp. Leaf123]